MNRSSKVINNSKESPDYSHILEMGDEAEVSKVHRNLANCPSFLACHDWITNHKNVSMLIKEEHVGKLLGEDSKPLLCKLEDEVAFTFGRTMMMFRGDPLMKRVNGIIDGVVEAGLYSYRLSLLYNEYGIYYKKIRMFQPLDGYYSFNLYHMQNAFYLIFIGLCLSAFCFMFELLYNRVLSKIM